MGKKDLRFNEHNSDIIPIQGLYTNMKLSIGTHKQNMVTGYSNCSNRSNCV